MKEEFTRDENKIRVKVGGQNKREKSIQNSI
jgi:hypothetical protein